MQQIEKMRTLVYLTYESREDEIMIVLHWCTDRHHSHKCPASLCNVSLKLTLDEADLLATLLEAFSTRASLGFHHCLDENFTSRVGVAKLEYRFDFDSKRAECAIVLERWEAKARLRTELILSPQDAAALADELDKHLKWLGYATEEKHEAYKPVP